MAKVPNPSDHRKADHPIDPIFIHRWSPRAMSGEPISPAELNTLFEAARWAPSAFNEQPWRLLFARRDTPHWRTFLELLVESNQSWCVNAAALVLFISSKIFSRNGKPNPVNIFDTGSCWENLALQGSKMGLVVHGMAGFDRDKARSILGVPERYDICAMAASGWPGDPDKLPPTLRDKDVPSSRKPVAQIVMEGGFKE